MLSVMKALFSLLLSFVACSACHELEDPHVKPEATPAVTSHKINDSQTPADFFVDDAKLSVNGFTIERRSRKMWVNLYSQPNNRRSLVRFEYVILKKMKNLLARFDVGLPHPLGSTANFGLFPFLGEAEPQVFISESSPRTGTQWVVDLTPHFRVIFDGQALGVGREAYDLNAIDLDNDGVYEIIAPITDFYQFQDKLYIGAIPLPEIIFKYDLAKQKYLPANSIFKERAFKVLVDVPKPTVDELNFGHRAAALSNLLTHIYAGDEQEGWKAFEKDYKLNDKAEMKKRIRKILRTQPVYKLTYFR